MLPLSKNKLAIYSRLASVKFRRKHSLFRAEGEKCVADTIEHYEPECLIVTAEWFEAARAADPLSPSGAILRHIGSDGRGILRVASSGDMKELSSMSNIPGVVAIYKLPLQPRYKFPLPHGEIYLLLDGIQDPGNLGTIIRAAHWFGVKTIFASHDTVDVYNPKAIQATMGSVAHVSIHYVDLISLVKDNSDIPIFTTALDGENIYSAALPDQAFIAMGSEGHGISPELRGVVSTALYIPPFNPDDHAESLNVGVATAIVLSEFRRKYLKSLS